MEDVSGAASENGICILRSVVGTALRRFSEAFENAGTSMRRAGFRHFRTEAILPQLLANAESGILVVILTVMLNSD